MPVTPINQICCGDSLTALRGFPDDSIDMCMTSPPYWALRDYNINGQIGLEYTVAEYIDRLIAVFAEVKRVLKATGTCWVNIGDTYAGSSKGVPGKSSQLHPKSKESWKFKKLPQIEKYISKCLLQVPARFSIAMTDIIGFILRNEIIWHKPNAMPDSATDRFTNDYEKFFFFVKTQRYYFNQQSEPLSDETLARSKRGTIGGKSKGYSGFGAANQIAYHAKVNSGAAITRNKRTVWSISTSSNHAAHFATYPEKLIEIPIMAGCPEGGIVLDPFVGSGTTAAVAKQLGRRYIGIDINPEYVKMAERRLNAFEVLPFGNMLCEETCR
ncbi:MAG: site-specific DNA-methyltransferase [Nitrospirota bacterium]